MLARHDRESHPWDTRMGTITEVEVDNKITYDRSSVKPLALQHSKAESGIAVHLSDLTGDHLCQMTKERWVR